MLRHGRVTVFSLLLALALSLLASGCGGGNEEAAVTLPTVERTEDSGDVATYKVDSADFSIAVPRSWQALTSDEIDQDAIDKIAAQNPEMRPDIEAMFTDPSSPVEFIAIDPDVRGNFATNVSVVVRDALPGDTVEELTSPEHTEAFERQAKGLLRGPVENVLVSLPAGEAQKLSYGVAAKGPEGNNLLLSQEQYNLIEGGKTYSLIYTALAERESEYADAFLQSARSFRVTQ
jgi:hypothetical protein